jgi:protein phosphatase methylesterase 1
VAAYIYLYGCVNTYFLLGKFQLSIFPDAGHFLQEDTPMKTASTLVEFWKRNQRLVLPPKVKI